MLLPRIHRSVLLLSAALLLQALGVSAIADTAARQSAEAFDPQAFAISLELVADGFDQPLYVTAANDGSDRLFVVEQPGRISIVRDGERIPEPFLDISNIVEAGGSEQGLLSVAFHPNYEENGQLFVGYTAQSAEGVGDNTIARYQVLADDPNRADPASGEILLAVTDPYRNHNGGLVLFGPDGYLYAGFGDGGAGGDPEQNAQNPGTLLGSILRLDVDGESAERPYAIPADNPFADGAEGQPEVWAYGLRNPWRFSFDRLTGELYVADVGQREIEEVNALPADGLGGENYGWPVMEGTSCFAVADCVADDLVLPVAEYNHEFGCSVTGGYVYRGEAIPPLQGVYLFADYCSGLLWGMGRGADGSWVTTAPMDTGLNISSFGEDAAGEMYVTDLNGGLYQITGPAA